MIGVTAKWLAYPGMTSRLNSNGTTQKAWMTSTEVRLNCTVSLVGISSSGRWLVGSPGRHIAPFSVTACPELIAYCGYWNCQLHCWPMTFTMTSGLAGFLSM